MPARSFFCRKHHRDRIPWFLFPLTLLAYFWRRSYVIGAGDQDEMLPLVLHRLNPDLFQTDWFVQSQAAGWTIRSYFLFVVEILSVPFGVDAAVTILYMLVWMAIAYNVYLLALAFIDSRVAAAASVILALAVCLHWTLGGNDLIQQNLVPEMVGWAFVLPGVRCFLQNRMLGSALLLGMAAWFHPLVGMLTALVLGLILLLDFVDRYRHRLARRNLATFFASFLVFASPAIIPILITEVLISAPTTPATPSAFYLLAEFRLPHHHLFHSFSMERIMRFALLALLGVVSLVLLARNGRMQRASFMSRFLGVTAGLCLFAYVFTEVIPVLTVAKLQFFKLTVWAKLLLIFAISGWIVTWIGGRMQRWIEQSLDNTGLGTAVCLAAWIATAGLIAGGIQPLYSKLQPVSHRATDLHRVEAWAAEHTSLDALFAVPPSIDSFRYHARRGIFVNFKSFPFQEPLMYEWFQRLMDVAPIEPPERGTTVLPDLDRAYHSMSHQRWRALGLHYGIEYVLVHRSDGAPIFDTLPVFESGRWAVFRLFP